MSLDDGLFWRWYAKLVGTAFAVVFILAGIGYWPTVRLSGGEGAVAMVAGCLISWASSCAGAVPLALVPAKPSAEQAGSVLVATGVRFVVVLLLVVPMVLSGWFDRAVLAIWVAISYLLLLVVDSAFTVHLLKRMSQDRTNE